MAKLNRRQLITLATGAWFTHTVFAADANRSNFISGRITSERSRTHILLESSHRWVYSQFTLNNPPRLVIDIKDVSPNNAMTQLTRSVPANDAFISQIRVGKKDAETTRMVFDLKRSVQTKFTVSNNVSGSLKNQLKIDIAALGAAIADTAAASGSDPIMDLLNNPPRGQDTRVVPAKRNGRPVIVLDAGHGGKDPGASSPSGTREKDVVLATALAVRKQLEAKGYTVYMTRNNDTFVPLVKRRQFAHAKNADLFISIHADASTNYTMRGADVFVWGRANSEHSREIAKSENDADRIDGLPSVGNKDVNAILADMMQAQTNTDSIRLGNLVLRQLSGHMTLRKPKVDTADFVVLRSVDIPSILIELGFISTPAEEKLLLSPEHRNKNAIAIANAVQQFLNTKK